MIGGNESEAESCIYQEEDRDTLHWSILVFEETMIPLVGTLGLVGNLVSIFVLRRPEMKSTFNQSLIMLAVVDILLLVNIIFIFSMDRNSMVHKYLFPFFLYPIWSIFLSWEMFLTMSIAAERLMAVYKPIHYRSHTVSTSTRIHMLTFILIPLLLATAVNFPIFFHFKYSHEKMRTKDNIIAIVWVYMPTSLRRDPSYIYYYWHWTRLLLTGIIPFAFLMTTNTIIFLGMKRNTLRRNQMNNRSTRTLIAIVAIFLICNLTRLILNMVDAITPVVDDCGATNIPVWYTFLMSLSHLLLTTNSAVNFLIYICIGRRFKQVLWEQTFGSYKKTITTVNNIEAKQLRRASVDIEMVTRTTTNSSGLTVESEGLVSDHA